MQLRHRTPQLFIAAALGVGGIALAGQATASADSTPTCGTPTAITQADTSTTPLSLAVPAYTGAGTAASVQISLQATTTFANEFLNTSTLTLGPGNATTAWVGTSNVLQANGPGLSSVSDVSVSPPFSGGPSFTAGPALPTLPANEVALEGEGGNLASTTAAPSSWTALGTPFTYTPGTQPVSGSGSVTYSSPETSDVVAAGAVSTYAGGSGTLSVIEDSSGVTSGETTAGGWAVSGSVTTMVSACALYTAAVSAPEVPNILLLPLLGLIAGGGALLVGRQRRFGNARIL
jgi:hypothetical protein